MAGKHPSSRPRRLRRSAPLRALVRETELAPADLVLPVFVKEGEGPDEPIASLPGCARQSVEAIASRAEDAWALGIRALALFPVVADHLKDRHATASTDDDGLVPRALRAVRDRCPEMLLITDVAMDPYSSDGHDGVLADCGTVLNDETLPILSDMARCHARAGADIVAPSDMMDGRVGAIRSALDAAGFVDTAILSYAVKYASALYGPFRDALDSAPRSGNKSTYQMDPANRREALRELALDEAEGADIVMVKPAQIYLDVIQRVRTATTLPIAAYQVSGEYSMIKAAAERGWIDGDAVVDECLLAIKRAGADIIFSYAALEVAERIRARLA